MHKSNQKFSYLADSKEHFDRHHSRRGKKYVHMKTHFYTITHYDVVCELWANYSTPEYREQHAFYTRLASDELRKQSFYKEIVDHTLTGPYKPWLVGYAISKKRARRWFKQNVNRFLVRKSQVI